MKITMSKVDLTKLDTVSEDTRKVVSNITKKDGTLYSTKPKSANGLEKYIWRMVVFMVSPKPQHFCIPVSADFDLYDWIEDAYDDVIPYREWNKLSEEEKKNSVHTYQRRNELKEYLRGIEDEILALIPKEQWHGVKRWSKAFYG